MLPSFSAFPTEKLDVVFWPTNCSNVLYSIEESILSRSIFLNIFFSFFTLDDISPEKYLWKCHELSTGIVNPPVLPNLQRNIPSQKLLDSWRLPHGRCSWAVVFPAGRHHPAPTVATPPCTPSPRGSSIPGEAAAHRAWPTLGSQD